MKSLLRCGMKCNAIGGWKSSLTRDSNGPLTIPPFSSTETTWLLSPNKEYSHSWGDHVLYMG
ncbi:hypothetical protein BDD12DRAFT_811139 [Trichophaea hybrida]|nr:hypothetical protein BDD12DRAFT_811139 [Trichophaea hybrida]